MRRKLAWHAPYTLESRWTRRKQRRVRVKQRREFRRLQHLARRAAKRYRLIFGTAPSAFIDYRNRDSASIDALAWERLTEFGRPLSLYRRVAQTRFARSGYAVSTVWIGLSATGKPFETMVFRDRNGISQAQSWTASEALAEHQRAVADVVLLAPPRPRR